MSNWTEKGELFEESQGSFPPEILATPVFSRQFVKDNEDGTFTVITFSAAGTFIDGEDRPEWHERGEGKVCDVQTCTETTVCRDPENIGDTEIDSDYAWDFVNWEALSVEAAEAYARDEVASISLIDFNGGN